MTGQKIPIRRGSPETLPWLREQHLRLWDWVSTLSTAKLTAILLMNSTDKADIAVKKAWLYWEPNWTNENYSFACLAVETERNRCFKCPLGRDYCTIAESPYQKFKTALEKHDFKSARHQASTIRDAWQVSNQEHNTNERKVMF